MNKLHEYFSLTNEFPNERYLHQFVLGALSALVTDEIWNQALETTREHYERKRSQDLQMSRTGEGG